MSTTGKKVLITGGGQGIGFALAKRFHSAGNQVILVGRRAETLDKAAAQLKGAISCVADISNRSEQERLVRLFPDIDILVNNAGIQNTGPIEHMNAADIEHEVAINFLAPVLLVSAYLPLLKQRSQSAIINVSSVLGLSPKQSASTYCASKAALHSYTTTLRWQLEGTSVRVFELIPPLVDTAMTANRGKGKISPDALANEFWRQFNAGTPDIYIGRAKAAKALLRLAPSLIQRILRHG